jgi:hypothetical protein
VSSAAIHGTPPGRPGLGEAVSRLLDAIEKRRIGRHAATISEGSHGVDTL